MPIESSAGISTTAATFRPTRPLHPAFAPARCNRAQRDARAGQPLAAPEFTGWFAGHEWDVALLQEAPPLWFAASGKRRRARRRGSHLAQRRAAAAAAGRELNPDLIASWEGGSNQLLVRAPGGSSSAATHDPHAAGPSAGDGVGARRARGRTRSHASRTSTRPPGCPQKATPSCSQRRPPRSKWSEGDPLVFGGDLNLRPGRAPGRLRGAARALRPG